MFCGETLRASQKRRYGPTSENCSAKRDSVSSLNSVSVCEVASERMKSNNDSPKSLNDKIVLTRFLVRLVFRYSHEIFKGERFPSQVLWQLNPICIQVAVANYL